MKQQWSQLSCHQLTWKLAEDDIVLETFKESQQQYRDFMTGMEVRLPQHVRAPLPSVSSSSAVT